MIQKEISIIPLSVNKAWQGRRFKTKAYKDFEKEMLLLLGRNSGKVNGDVEIIMEFYFKNDKMRDIDNCVKPTLDCVVKAGLIQDDRKVKHLDIYKYHSEKERINIVINKIL